MIAIYARQSLDKKDSVSIETQISLCKKEIADGSSCKVFEDRGFSGKNIDRPAFAELLGAIENGEISRVVVYRLDRISRSITDFANIIEIFEKHKVDFVSANEKFDTSTPVGRAMLYIIMVFAQLERETIAERIKDNYYSRGKTGVWLGGPAPFGFTNEKIVVGNKKISTIKPNADLEAVKEIFHLYADTGMSLGNIAKRLLTQYDVMWNNIKLSRILHNPAYVKADADVYSFFRAKKCIIVNDIQEFTGERGCNLYGKRDRGSNKYRDLDELILSLSLHEGVVDSQTWLRCQYKLEKNRQIRNSGKGKHTWLTGLVKCGYCGYAMNVKASNGRKYFNCSGRYTTNLCEDKLETHYVEDIEDHILSAMRTFIDGLNASDVSLADKSFDMDINRLKIELLDVENQIESLVNGLIHANPVLYKYANEKIMELDMRKKELLSEIGQKSVKPLPANLPDMESWDSFDGSLKRDAAQQLITRVLVYNDKIEVDWKY